MFSKCLESSRNIQKVPEVSRKFWNLVEFVEKLREILLHHPALFKKIERLRVMLQKISDYNLFC